MRFHFLAIILLGAGAAAAAQPQPESNDIVVEGRLNPHKQIRDFVKELTPAHVGAQLGRFVQPVCPRVVGLSDAENALVEARIRKVAASVGAPVASPGCGVGFACGSNRS